MAREPFQEASRLILKEIGGALAGVQEKQAAALVEATMQANAVFVTGEGRSGLVARCFAMRLMHLGLTAHVVGESATPALKKGDLLVAVSGTGESEITGVRARLAATQGGRVAALTASEDSSLASLADLVVAIPAGGRGTTAQFGGSQFEQAALVALEAVVLELQEQLGQSTEEMKSRHATVE